MSKIKVSIAGASGYVGGEALRILLSHPKVEVVQATSERNTGKYVYFVHPNLRKKTKLKFSSVNDLEKVDVLFLALPHGLSSKKIDYFKKKADYIIDKGSDFRLKDPKDYIKYYKHKHPKPELLKDFTYGIPELHREKIKKAKYVAAAGCNATATILGLYPLYKKDLVEKNRTVVEVKAGSSQGGAKASIASHHPERRDCLRSYAPTGHRHCAEVLQELDFEKVYFSATSVNLVRGILATSHCFLKDNIKKKDIWKTYREIYGEEPFIRIVKEMIGIYRYPEPKILQGTNYCDVGFELDRQSNRIVVISALDNLMKGAAGQAVQCMNLMLGYEETTGLEFPGLHPV
ncbi:N-acetyl-gamma-glutamyl-phosphate reductase [Candidatus Woesearchaeota archaeon]|nr:N-acetyl-gamma-glutamyl-phosphate reductase [Candidatus Woesearchaeota archaeon]